MRKKEIEAICEFCKDWNLANCDECDLKQEAAEVINPCKDCKDRHINCHADCEKYIEAKQEHDKQQDEIRKSKFDDYNTFTLPCAHVRKRRKK